MHRPQCSPRPQLGWAVSAPALGQRAAACLSELSSSVGRVWQSQDLLPDKQKPLGAMLGEAVRLCSPCWEKPGGSRPPEVWGPYMRTRLRINPSMSEDWRGRRPHPEPHTPLSTDLSMLFFTMIVSTLLPWWNQEPTTWWPKRSLEG